MKNYTLRDFYENLTFSEFKSFISENINEFDYDELLFFILYLVRLIKFGKLD